MSEIGEGRREEGEWPWSGGRRERERERKRGRERVSEEREGRIEEIFFCPLPLMCARMCLREKKRELSERERGGWKKTYSILSPLSV